MSICCTASPRAAPTSRACPTAHSTSTSEQARPTRSGRLRSTTWTNSIRPLARSCALPHARISPGLVADHDVLPGPQAVQLDRHVLLAGAGPAAALPLVAAQELGDPAYLSEVVGVRRADGPAVGQPFELLDQLSGIWLEPAHGSLIIPYRVRSVSVE